MQVPISAIPKNAQVCFLNPSKEARKRTKSYDIQMRLMQL